MSAYKENLKTIKENVASYGICSDKIDVCTLVDSNGVPLGAIGGVPALGQAVEAACLPVVLPLLQVADLKDVNLSATDIADLKKYGGGDTLLNTNGASGANLIVATVGKKHRIWKLYVVAGASTTVALSDGCGTFKTDLNGILELDFNPVGNVQGTANTNITLVTGDASAWYATVIFKDE